ncbi:hypothetical protein MTsPCn5_08510 [Croceitalea sp. MTPC5]|uniref:hypothetical protein n=1 Tax=Croceitalea sp. MTPC5 TaxID=3056565 RepID=UPI002B3FEA3E|nr:hypothetical protein MTsPCn5_08510 [Croceitalea sp. MTPC5]
MYLFALLFDTGLLVLIWLVQLVIYPGLKHYSLKNLKKWHRSYTKRITVVVLPLMFGQLLFTTLLAIKVFDTLNTIKLLMVITAWVLTFSIFVPLHGNIENTNENEAITKKLVVRNWSRTILWSLIFTIGLIRILTLDQSWPL